jgi:hypothetical protein
MTAKHAPTPWEIAADGTFKASNRRYVIVWEPANAEFLVRAVNAHDDLVTALKEASLYVQSSSDCYARIRSTLDKAEGRS